MGKVAISTDKAPAAIGPYSQAVKAGGFVFLSGSIPVDPSSGAVVVGGIEAQARRVLANIEAVLKKASSDLTLVVKTTVFLKDISDFEAVNRVYGEFFSEPFPARSTVEVSELPKGVMIEMDAIACMGEAR